MACHICSLFCLVQWMCWVKLSSVHRDHVNGLGTEGDDSLKHTAIEAAAPLGSITLAYAATFYFNCFHSRCKLTQATRAASAFLSAICSWSCGFTLTMASVHVVRCHDKSGQTPDLRNNITVLHSDGYHIPCPSTSDAGPCNTASSRFSQVDAGREIRLGRGPARHNLGRVPPSQRTPSCPPSTSSAAFPAGGFSTHRPFICQSRKCSPPPPQQLFQRNKQVGPHLAAAVAAASAQRRATGR